MTHVLLHQAGDMEQKLWNFYQVSVPHVSDPGDMEQKLWNFYQDSVPHVSDSGDMEQSSETVVFHKFS